MKQTNENKMLALAIKLASEVHQHQFDNGGNPYILHPIQVMYNLNSDDPELKQIAILHDVVEDCIKQILVKFYRKKDSSTYKEVVEDIMKNKSNEEKVDLVLSIFKEWGFSDRVRAGLKLMTKLNSDIGEEGYFSYIKRMFDNVDAIRVKLADIRHNTDILRLKGLTDKDFARNRKYCIAFSMLTDRLKELCGSQCVA